MGSDHARGRRLADRCCQGACFGVGFFSTAFAVIVMFWILWCYLGLSVVQVADSQRRGSPGYSYNSTTRRPVNHTDVPVVESSVNAIYKTATTLASSYTASTDVSAQKQSINAGRAQGGMTQAKGDFADRSRDVTNPTSDAARGSKPKDLPSVNLTSGTLYEGVEDGIHPRRVHAASKENRHEEGGLEKEKLPRVDISPTQVDTDNRPKSNNPNINEREPSSKDSSSSSTSRRDDIQSSRRSESDYRDPDFERDYPRSSPRYDDEEYRRYRDRYDDGDDSRRYRDRYDDGDDSRRYRDRYDDRDRGRETADKLSKGDTRVYPDRERDSNPDRRPVDDERYDQGRRGDYPRSSSRRNDDDSRNYRDRAIDRPRSRDSEDKYDSRRGYPEYDKDRYSDRKLADDEISYDKRRRGDDDRPRPDNGRYQNQDDYYRSDYPSGSSRSSEETDEVRRRDNEGRHRDTYDDGYSSDNRDGSRYESRDYPPRDRKPVREEEERIRDGYGRDRSPLNSRSSPSLNRKDGYEEEEDNRRPSYRSDERGKIFPTRVISPSETSYKDRTRDRYPDDDDVYRTDRYRIDDRREDRTRMSDDRREDRIRMSDDRREDRTRMPSDRREDRTRMSDDRREDRTRVSDDRREDRTRMSEDRREDRTRMSDDRREDRTRMYDDRKDRTRMSDNRNYQTRSSEDRPGHRTRSSDGTEYHTRQPNRYDHRDDVSLETRSYPSEEEDEQDSRTKLRSEEDDRDSRRPDPEYNRRSDEGYGISRPRGDYESGRPRHRDDDRPLSRKYGEDSRERDPRVPVGTRKPSTRDSYPDDDRDRRDRPSYIDDRYRPDYADGRDHRNRPGDVEDRYHPEDTYNRENRRPSREEDDLRPQSRYPEDRRQPSRVTSTGSSTPTREKRPQDGRNDDAGRPQSPQDVIEAAQRQHGTSDTSGREVSYPVFNPKGSNLTSPDIIRTVERKGTMLTSRRKRSLAGGF